MRLSPGGLNPEAAGELELRLGGLWAGPMGLKGSSCAHRISLPWCDVRSVRDDVAADTAGWLADWGKLTPPAGGGCLSGEICA